MTVEKVWLAHDVGRALNPVLVEGQVEGSIYMALGEVLMEEQDFRGERGPRVLGVHRVPSMLEYKSPTTFETPEMHVFLVETLDPEGPFGAKEVGQGPLLPVIPAVANAVYDAVGVRIDETPITPEKVLRALEARAEGKPARYGPTKIPTYPFPRTLKVPTPWADGAGVNAALAAVSSTSPRAPSTKPPRCSPNTVQRAVVVAGGTDLFPNMKRRQQEPPVVIGLRSIASLRAIEIERQPAHRRHRFAARRGHPPAGFAQRYPALAHAAGAGVDAAPAAHGHAGRQPVPGYALHLLRPVLPLAQEHRLLHEEGRRDLLGRPQQPALLGGLQLRYRAGGGRAARSTDAGQRRAATQRRSGRVFPRRRHPVPDPTSRTRSCRGSSSPRSTAGR